MSVVYKVLSTWWRLVMLWGLLVVCTSSVLMVPTTQAQGNSLRCVRDMIEPELCMVTVTNTGDVEIAVQVEYRGSGLRMQTSSLLRLSPGQQFVIEASFIESVSVFQVIPLGSTWTLGSSFVKVFKESLSDRDRVDIDLFYDANGQRFSVVMR